MTHHRQDGTAYSRAEYVSDAAVHLLGVGVALAGVPVLITLAVLWRGDAPAMLGITVYSATLLAMLVFSALYNMLPQVRLAGLLRRLDHGAIYLKIAGTYTPFSLLSGGHGGAVLAGLWAAAFAGLGLKLWSPSRFRWFALALYLGMGWVAALLGWDMFAALSGPVLGLVLAGGLVYTAGVAFYLAEGLAFHNTIWHVFVLTATALFFIAIGLHLADTSLAAGG